MSRDIINPDLERDLVLYNDSLISVFFDTLSDYLSRWGSSRQFMSLVPLGLFSPGSPLTIQNFLSRYQTIAATLPPNAYPSDSGTKSSIENYVIDYLDTQEIGIKNVVSEVDRYKLSGENYQKYLLIFYLKDIAYRSDTILGNKLLGIQRSYQYGDHQINKATKQALINAFSPLFANISAVMPVTSLMPFTVTSTTSTPLKPLPPEDFYSINTPPTLINASLAMTASPASVTEISLVPASTSLPHVSETTTMTISTLEPFLNVSSPLILINGSSTMTTPLISMTEISSSTSLTPASISTSHIFETSSMTQTSTSKSLIFKAGLGPILTSSLAPTFNQGNDTVNAETNGTISLTFNFTSISTSTLETTRERAALGALLGSAPAAVRAISSTDSLDDYKEYIFTPNILRDLLTNARQLLATPDNPCEGSGLIFLKRNYQFLTVYLSTSPNIPSSYLSQILDLNKDTYFQCIQSLSNITSDSNNLLNNLCATYNRLFLSPYHQYSASAIPQFLYALINQLSQLSDYSSVPGTNDLFDQLTQLITLYVQGGLLDNNLGDLVSKMSEVLKNNLVLPDRTDDIVLIESLTFFGNMHNQTFWNCKTGDWRQHEVCQLSQNFVFEEYALDILKQAIFLRQQNIFLVLPGRIESEAYIYFFEKAYFNDPALAQKRCLAREPYCQTLTQEAILPYYRSILPFPDMQVDVYHKRLNNTYIDTIIRQTSIDMRNIFNKNFPPRLSNSTADIKLRIYAFWNMDSYRFYSSLFGYDANNGGITYSPGSDSFTADHYVFQLADGSLLNLAHEMVHGLQFHYFGEEVFSLLNLSVLEGMAEEFAYNQTTPPFLLKFIATNPKETLSQIFNVTSYGDTEQVYRWGWLATHYLLMRADSQFIEKLTREIQNENQVAIYNLLNNFASQQNQPFLSWLDGLRKIIPQGFIEASMAPIFVAPGKPVTRIAMSTNLTIGNNTSSVTTPESINQFFRHKRNFDFLQYLVGGFNESVLEEKFQHMSSGDANNDIRHLAMTSGAASRNVFWGSFSHSDFHLKLRDMTGKIRQKMAFDVCSYQLSPCMHEEIPHFGGQFLERMLGETRTQIPIMVEGVSHGILYGLFLNLLSNFLSFKKMIILSILIQFTTGVYLFWSESLLLYFLSRIVMCEIVMYGTIKLSEKIDKSAEKLRVQDYKYTSLGIQAASEIMNTALIPCLFHQNRVYGIGQGIGMRMTRHLRGK
jgi:hypothetical protein